MNKWFKKAVAIVLTTAMSMSICAPAFANQEGNRVLTEAELEEQYLELSELQPRISMMKSTEERPSISELQNRLLENNKTGAHRVYSEEDIIVSPDTPMVMASNTPATANVISVDGSYWKYLSAGDECWFTFQTVESQNYLGAYDIYTSGSLDTRAYLYQENANGTLSLVTSNDNGNGVNAYMSVDLKGSTVYYVKITATAAGSTTLYTLRHVDAGYASERVTMWRPYINSPYPDTGKIVPGIYYLTALGTRDLCDELDKPDVLAYLADSIITEVGGSAAVAHLVSIGVKETIAKCIVFLFIDNGIDLAVEKFRADIAEASNDETNGIKIVVTRDTQFGEDYDITSWTNNAMKGAPGYRGEFIDDVSQM